jgi:hypothetical protein
MLSRVVTSKDTQDAGLIGIRCPKCGERHEKPLGWVRANLVMQCAGCGVTIRLNHKRLPAPALLSPADSWWTPRMVPYGAAAAVVVAIGIIAYAYASARYPSRPVLIPPSNPAPAYGSVPAAAPVLICEFPPANGQIMTAGRRLGTAAGMHSITIQNGTEGDAIVVVRDVYSGEVVVSFFVATGRNASFAHLPNGTYRIQWAFGDVLGAGCSTFAGAAVASEFEQQEIMQTKAVEGCTEYEAITLTLYAVPQGTARSHSIPLEQFYAK